MKKKSSSRPTYSVEFREAVVKDGYEALGRLLKEEFDCLITSKSVSTINGIQLIQSLNVYDSPNKNILKILITTDKKTDFHEPNCHTLIKNQELLPNLEMFFDKQIKTIEANNIQTYELSAKNQSKPLNRILCVDDDKLLQKVIKISLKSIPNIEIECCMSPIKALEIVKDHTPDLLILDVMMEEMNGIELAKEIKKFKPDVPIIFLTGKTNPKDIKVLQEQGAIEIISKPFKPKNLYERVLAAWAKNQA